MNISEILKQGFKPEEVEYAEYKYIIYTLDVEHPFFKGLHISIDLKHEMISVYCKDLDFNTHFRIHEAFANETNLLETIKFFTYDAETEKETIT